MSYEGSADVAADSQRNTGGLKSATVQVLGPKLATFIPRSINLIQQSFRTKTGTNGSNDCGHIQVVGTVSLNNSAAAVSSGK